MYATLVVSALALAGGAALAQSADPAMHAVVTYFHVTPEHEGPYVEHVKNVSRKFYQELMAQPGSKLVYWDLARIVFPGDEPAAANFAAATLWEGVPRDPGELPPDDLFRKASGLSRDEYMKKLRGMRTTAGSTIYRNVAMVSASRDAKEFYRVITQVRRTPKRMADWVEMERTIWRPLASQRVKDGLLRGWSSWTAVFPFGMDASHDAIEVTTHHSFEQAVQGWTGGNFAEYFAKVHPKMNIVTAVDRTRETRTIKRGTIWRVLVSEAKPGWNGPTASGE
jgi:hypothetical protein